MSLCDGNYGLGAYYGMDLVYDWEPEQSRVTINIIIFD